METELLQQVLDALRTAGGAGWEIAVRGTFRQALVSMAFGVAMIVIGGAMAVPAWRAARKAGAGDDAELTWGVTALVAIGLLFVGLVVSGCSAEVLVAPDWAALKTILGR